MIPLKQFGFFVLCLSSLLICKAQPSYYSYTRPTGDPYLSLSGATALASPGWTTGSFWWMPCPVNFSFYGEVQDSIFVSADGWIGFQSAGSMSMDVFLSAYKDIGVSSISYKVSGAPGSRILKLEWRNVGISFDSSGAFYLNFQVWLYEGTSCIEVHVGDGIVDPGGFEDPFIPGVQTGPKVGVQYDMLPDLLYLEGDNLNPSTFTSFTLPFPAEPMLTGLSPSGAIFRFCPTPVSLEQSHPADEVRVFPNPASGELRIVGAKDIFPDGCSVSLVNAAGKVMKNLEWAQCKNEYSVCITDIPPGFYLLHITSSYQKITKAVLIQ